MSRLLPRTLEELATAAIVGSIASAIEAADTAALVESQRAAIEAKAEELGLLELSDEDLAKLPDLIDGARATVTVVFP